MDRRSWTDKDLEQALKYSNSFSEVVRKLGLVNTAGNRTTVKKYIRKLNLDYSHLHNKPFHKAQPKPLNDILIENSEYSNSTGLKKRLIKENLLENKCSECKITQWQGKKLSLQLDHINGNRTDNRIENLRLLCPNCHSQTPTFSRGQLNQRPKNKCKCGVVIRNESKHCRKCSDKERMKKGVVKWPDNDSLAYAIATSNYTAVSKTLGVSDNAVRKHISKRFVLIENPSDIPNEYRDIVHDIQKATNDLFFVANGSNRYIGMNVQCDVSICDGQVVIKPNYEFQNLKLKYRVERHGVVTSYDVPKTNVHYRLYL